MESRRLLDAAKHRQRGHMVLTAVRRVAGGLEAAGFHVDVQPAAFAGNSRMTRPLRGPDRLGDLEDVRIPADDVRDLLGAGRLWGPCVAPSVGLRRAR